MNEPAIFKLDEQFVSDIRNIIITARTTAIRSVDFERVKMYWKLGERIMLEEQGGKERAEYGRQSSEVDFPIGNWPFAVSSTTHTEI